MSPHLAFSTPPFMDEETEVQEGRHFLGDPHLHRAPRAEEAREL